ncbi:hypothetical protein MD484_g1769, partial [Candolleomyces efflorescens]
MLQRRGPYIHFIQYGFTELRRVSKDDVPHRSWTRSEIIEAANAQLAAAGQSRGRQAIQRYDEGLAQWVRAIQATIPLPAVNVNDDRPDGHQELNGFIQRQSENPDDIEPSFSITPLGAEILDGLLAIGNTLAEPNTADGSSRPQREVVRNRVAGAARKKSRLHTAGINALRKKHFIRTSGFQKYTLADGLPPTPGPEPEPREDATADSDAMDVDVDVQAHETVDMSATPVAPQRSIDSAMAYPSPMSIQRPPLVNMDAHPEPPNVVDQVHETPSRSGGNSAEQSTSTSYLGSIFRSLRFPGLNGGSSSRNQAEVDEANRKVTELEGLLKEAQAQLEAVISEKDENIMDLQGQRVELQRRLHELEQELDDVKRDLNDIMTRLEGVMDQNLEQARAIERLETIERTMGIIANAIAANPNTMEMV